ncbi:unnamed protein product [Prorocentrum cordatum]|uniref:CCR4-NOT transcription complex subunit 11 n=1 Tax=Prorocentrum cordatum TaxID=2364126 RepID=A0ABN9UUI2_9DINO|nr:unnamed protein product [Polarella glacialis]
MGNGEQEHKGDKTFEDGGSRGGPGSAPAISALLELLPAAPPSCELLPALQLILRSLPPLSREQLPALCPRAAAEEMPIVGISLLTASVEPVVPTPAPPAVVDAAAQDDAAMAETTVAQAGAVVEAPPAPEVATPARAQEPVADAGTTEALHCAATLAQGGDPDEAVALLRNECAGAPAHLLADVHHKVLEACLRQDKVDTACELVTEPDIVWSVAM